MKEIDARGLSCPEPVLLTKEAIDSGAKELLVLVDDRTPLENVTRYAENHGFKTQMKEEAGVYRIALTKV